VRNYWHPVAASAEVGEQPRRVTLLGQDLVVFRHQDGVSVFDDVCIHRGTALSLGWITEGRLTCAYHGWQYDRTGACVRIPALPEGAPIPRKACATVRRSDEAYGLVWVALDEPCAPIPQFPNGEWEDREYRGFLALSYQWKTSAGRAVENFMDFSHFPFVHEGLLGSGDRTVVEPHEIVETDYGFLYSFQQEEPSTVHSAEDEVVTWEYYLYRPFTIHLKKRTSDGNATLISMAAAPSAEDHTHMWVWIVRNYDKDPSEDQRFADFSNTIMEQDRVVVESQRPERIPVDLREELHLKVPDASGIAFRRMLSTIAQVAPFMP
jgi:phenylpropionate dioxygenase-like ring-hydroxylating dioxygenase large terminal subunit